MRQRIQKVLADAGVAGRRTIEEMVLEGRITVNDRLVTSLPCFVDTSADKIAIDGEIIRIKPAARKYFLLNKPRNVASIRRSDVKTVYDLVPPSGILHCVGPLNSGDSGLVLLTTDGELAQLLTHPRYGLEKTYRAEIEGKPEAAAIAKLKQGVFIGKYRTEGAKVKIVSRSPQRSVLMIELAEGKNGEIRRVMRIAGLNPMSIRRTAFGPLTDEGLKPGSHRRVSVQEVEKLRAAVRRH